MVQHHQRLPATQYSIDRFDLMIDWGWFYFLTKPMFWLLEHITAIVGNFGLAILVVTVLVKLVFFPLANKSYESMSKMKKLQPEMEKIKQRYPDDRMKQQQEMMELYKREKVSPLAGCLPVVVQIPVFFALYKVIYVTIEMRHAPFFGWIQRSLGAGSDQLFNLFGLIPWTPPHLLMIGVWPIIMGITMWLQMRLNPDAARSDPGARCSTGCRSSSPSCSRPSRPASSSTGRGTTRSRSCSSRSS